MIRLENLSKSFPDGDLFLNVTISIKCGMRVGLVGPNGSGKTTLLKIMLGQESQDSGNVMKEKSISIGYLEQEIITGSNRSILEEVLDSYPELKELETKIKFLTEEISKNTEKMDLVNQLGDAQNRFEALDGWNIEEKAKKIMSGLGFREHQFIQKMETFSGGWRMRVALAAILLQNPDILFLDEPTNHLDLEATIWLESFLSEWKGGMVMISHDRTFLDRSVNNILEIDLKKITLYKGNYSEFKKEKTLRLEQHRAAYKNQQKQIKDTEKFIERFRYKNTKATQVQSRVKMLDKMDRIEAPTEDNQVMNLILPQPTRPPLNVASCQNVTKHFGKIEVFNEMNLSVERGQKIGLVGYNGAGKSTLLKLLGGVETVTEGAIRITNGVDIAYYAQHQLEILTPNDTVFETIRNVSTGWSESEIRTYLGRFLFSGNEIEKFVKVLSGGEKSRLALARMLVDPCHLLLLDEPTNHLDMVTRNVVEEALSKFAGSIVCISHDRHFLNKVTSLTCEVGGGGIRLYEGNYEYYEWKKSESQPIKRIHKKKSHIGKKQEYQRRKKNRNRIAWIEKRFRHIENELGEQKKVTKDPAYADNFEKLQKAMESMNKLENEYLELMGEQEILTKTV